MRQTMRRNWFDGRWRPAPCWRALSLLAAIVVVALVAGCSTGMHRARSRPLAGLVVHCRPADADVFVDGRFVGQARGFERAPLRLSPGLHRVELRHHGYFASYHETQMVEGIRQQLLVTLRKVPF